MRDRTSHYLAFFTLCVAVIAIAIGPILIRLSETELGAHATIFNRLFLFVLIFGPTQLISRYWVQQPSDTAPSEATQPKAMPDKMSESGSEAEAHPSNAVPSFWIHGLMLTSLGGLAMGAMLLSAIALQHTTVAKCMLLSNLTPIFTSLGAWLFLSKRFDNQFLLGMAIALTGAMALSIGDLGGEEGLLTGDLLAAASAALRGAYFLIVERLRAWFSATVIVLWRCGVGSLVLFPWVLWTEGRLFPTTLTAVLAVVGLGLISEGLGHRLLADTMKQFSSSFVSLFLMLEPLVGALLAWVVLTEPLGWQTWLGFAVVLTGIYLAKSDGAQSDKVTAQA